MDRAALRLSPTIKVGDSLLLLFCDITTAAKAFILHVKKIIKSVSFDDLCPVLKRCICSVPEVVA